MRFTSPSKWDILSAKQPLMSVLKGATQHIGGVSMKGLQCVERLLLSFWKKEVKNMFRKKLLFSCLIIRRCVSKILRYYRIHDRVTMVCIGNLITIEWVCAVILNSLVIRIHVWNVCLCKKSKQKTDTVCWNFTCVHAANVLFFK